MDAADVDLEKLKKLITAICVEAEPHKQVLAKSLGGISLKMEFTDIPFALILTVDREGIISPVWDAINPADLEVSATKQVWDDIFTSQLDYKQAYLQGRLRAKGSMAKLLKGSRGLGALINISREVEASMKEDET